MLRGAILAALALASLVDGAAFRVPLERHASHSFESQLAAVRALGKVSSVWEPRFPTDADKHPPVPVSVVDVFSATLNFGTPPQPVSVLLDINSAESAVLNHAVDVHPYYDHTKSSTYQPNGTRVRVPWGDFEGFVSRDHVSVGAEDRIDARDHFLVEIDGSDDTIRSLGPTFGGVVGLGPGHAKTTGAPSFVRVMIEQGVLDRPEVGVCFRERDAHIIVGGVDENYKPSDFKYFGLRNGLWAAPLGGISVSGQRLVGDAGYPMLSYWPFIVGPKDAIDALAHAVGAKNGELPCDGPGPDIVLELTKDLHVTIPKADYVYNDGSDVCKFRFVSVGFNVWMFGMPFWHSAYAVLDFGTSEGAERLGIAPIQRK